MEKEDMDDALVEEVVVDMDDALEDRLLEVDTEEAHRLDHPVGDTVVDHLQVALKDDIEVDHLLVEVVEVDTEGVQEVDLVGATLVVHHEMVADTLLVALEDHLLEVDIEEEDHLDRLVDDTVVDRLLEVLKDDIGGAHLLAAVVEADTEGVQEADLVGATLVVHHEMVVDTLLVALEEDHRLEMDIVVGHLDRLHEVDTRVAQVVELEEATRKTLPHAPHLVDTVDTAIAIVGHLEVERHRRKKRRKPLF